MSTVSESQPWCAMVSAAKLLGMASQPLTAAPPAAQVARSLFALTGASSGVGGWTSTVERRALRVELPPGNQVLHGHRVVARAQAVLLVQLVRLLHFGHVELDAQAGLLRHVDHAAHD